MILKKRILYVEDDKDWQQDIQDSISSLGYILHFASSAKEAMYLLRKNTYHVALLDKRLNENDVTNEQGLELAHIISGMDEETNIIVYTSHGEKDDLREAFRKIKVWDFIDKAKPLSEIIKAIREAGEDAEARFNRPLRRMPFEALNITKSVLNEFLNAVEVKDSPKITGENLDVFAKYMLSGYHPLLADKSEASLLKVLQFTVLQIRFWSKALGIPIATWIGKHDDMMSINEKAISDHRLKETFGINSKLSERLIYESIPTLGGVVFELNNTDIEEFASQIAIRS